MELETKNFNLDVTIGFHAVEEENDLSKIIFVCTHANGGKTDENYFK